MHPLVQRQIHGEPIHDDHEHKVEYHLRNRAGRTMMTFDNRERAKEQAERRGLSLFRVTIMAEKL